MAANTHFNDLFHECDDFGNILRYTSHDIWRTDSQSVHIFKELLLILGGVLTEYFLISYVSPLPLIYQLRKNFSCGPQVI